MSRIHYNDIVDKIREMCIESNYSLSKDVMAAYEKALETEKSPLGQEVLSQIMENARIADKEGVPLCQDTGLAVFFVEVGQDVSIVGGLLNDAINEGVRQGYHAGYLRKSVVQDPIFERRNTSDNTPAIIHAEIVAGDRLKIMLDIAGGGCENMAALKMLRPSDGLEGVKYFVVETVRNAGANPCPPVVVGVGIGGDFEKVAMLAKKALLRPVGQPNPKLEVAALEEDLLKRVNQLGIGPVGLGGVVTALAVHIEIHPCHIASLPVAVNLGCHSSRHKNITL
ncbi:MAG: fumarate hydratase [Thermodesulfovibrio sp. RBG_19FT_COMBO_42_12]|nr:fumarate hydratase [Nitrospirota bacterium]OHE54952.1 MAG: fumarate hydratase [Thermodesulfovibrio sp. RBG_19FT_COMBO_42_12]